MMMKIMKESQEGEEISCERKLKKRRQKISQTMFSDKQTHTAAFAENHETIGNNLVN